MYLATVGTYSWSNPCLMKAILTTHPTGCHTEARWACTLCTDRSQRPLWLFPFAPKYKQKSPQTLHLRERKLGVTVEAHGEQLNHQGQAGLLKLLTLGVIVQAYNPSTVKL